MGVFGDFLDFDCKRHRLFCSSVWFGTDLALFLLPCVLCHSIEEDSVVKGKHTNSFNGHFRNLPTKPIFLLQGSYAQTCSDIGNINK